MEINIMWPPYRSYYELAALNYHLRRMRNRYGFKEIVDNGNGNRNWLFKFSNELGMFVADQSPWMVNSKPLMMYKWDSSLGVNKVDPTKLLVCVKLTEVPMEAWTTEGLSAISSSVVEASKGFKELIELQYMDKNQNVKGTKNVKVVYDWKPPMCSHFVAIRRMILCRISLFMIAIEKEKVAKNPGLYKQYRKQWNKKTASDEGSIANKNKVNIAEEKFLVLNNKKNQKTQNNNKDKQRDTNSFSVLRDLGEDNIQGIDMMKDKMIVDKYLNIKLQPSLNVTKTWSQRMINYFKRSLEADREKERNERLNGMDGIVEDVLEDESIAAMNLVANELNVGCNSDVVNVLMIHSTRHMILCLIENIQKQEKMCCSFIYAANTRMERRSLWRDMQIAKCITNGYPWVLVGDFNVTLKLDEHSAGKSTISSDMQEFIDCVHLIEVEDMCMTGMHCRTVEEG
ncbi:RNA-directed DNA polymerase, eukaryota, reverse transcriptase zinc-binding domain protein [Tanacetum coccineum]